MDDETLFFHTQLAALDTPLPDADGGRFVEIPSSPWQHDASYWCEDHSALRRMPNLHLLLGRHIEMLSATTTCGRPTSTPPTMPWLADRVLDSRFRRRSASSRWRWAPGRKALDLPAEASQVVGSNSSIRWSWTGRSASPPVRSERRRLPRRDPRQVRHRILAPAPVATVVAAPGVAPAEGRAELADLGTGWAETDIVLPDGDRRRPVQRPSRAPRRGAAHSFRRDPGDADTTHLPTALADVRIFGEVGRQTCCRTELVAVDGEGRRLSRPDHPLDDAGNPTAGIRRHRTRAGRSRFGAGIAGADDLRHGMGGEPAPGRCSRAGGGQLAGARGRRRRDAVIAGDGVHRASGSPTRRVIRADPSAAATVRDAVAAAADLERPPPAWSCSSAAEFDSADPDGVLGRARDMIVAMSTPRATAGSWQ